MTRFEIMSEEEARRIVDYTRRAIAAHLAGGIHSDDPKVRAEARLISLQAETYADRAAAKRRLRSVTDDMGEEEYRAVSAREAGPDGARPRERRESTGASVQTRGHVR